MGYSNLEELLHGYFLQKGESDEDTEIEFDLKYTFLYLINKKREGILKVTKDNQTIEYKVELTRGVFKRENWNVRCQGGTLCDDPEKVLDLHVKERKDNETNEVSFSIESSTESTTKSGFSKWFYGDDLDTMRKLYEKIPAAKDLLTYRFLKYAGMTCFTSTVGIELAIRLADQKTFWLTLVYTLGTYAMCTAMQTWMAKRNADKITNKTPASTSNKLFNNQGLLMRSNKELNSWAHFEKYVIDLFEENRLSDFSLKEKNFGERLQEGYLSRKAYIYFAIGNAVTSQDKIKIIEDAIPLDYSSLTSLERKKLNKLTSNLKQIDEEYIKELGKSLFDSFEDKGILLEAMKPSLEKFLKEDYINLINGNVVNKLRLDDITALLEQKVKVSVRKNTVEEDYEVIHKTTELNTWCTGLEIISYAAGYSLLFFLHLLQLSPLHKKALSPS